MPTGGGTVGDRDLVSREENPCVQAEQCHRAKISISATERPQARSGVTRKLAESATVVPSQCGIFCYATFTESAAFSYLDAHSSTLKGRATTVRANSFPEGRCRGICNRINKFQ